RRWYPHIYYDAPAKAGGHRALVDILESIAELRYYRATLFVPPPGPHAEERERAARAATGGAQGARSSGGRRSSPPQGSPAGDGETPAPAPG
ncbi:hypothetical protein OVW19_28130, partial [Klebsiella pneumoniae]|nr:hypothetical protein [Klebsiella pneumoniae]